MFAYPAPVRKDGNGFAVSFPDLPAFSEGDTVEEAILEASDALETALSVYVDRRRDLPVASRIRTRTKHSGAFREAYFLIRPSALGAMKLALYTAMRDQGIRKADLARLLGQSKTEMDRLLDLTHASRVHQIEAALRVLGKRVEIAVQPAA